MKNILATFILLCLFGPSANAVVNYPAPGGNSGLIIGTTPVVSAPANSQFPLVCTLGQQCILGVLRGANFNVTTDQQIAVAPFTALTSGQLYPATKYIVTGFYVDNCSLSMTTATGGLYTAASKGGTALVAATQTYTNCTSSTTMQTGTIAAAAQSITLTGAILYFSLTANQTQAATGDVYVVGVPFD